MQMTVPVKGGEPRDAILSYCTPSAMRHFGAVWLEERAAGFANNHDKIR